MTATPGSQSGLSGSGAVDVSRSPDAGYEPAVPISVSPIFDWPPRPLAVLRYLLSPVMLPYGVCFAGLALVVWLLFTPSLDRMETLSAGWMLEVWLRNAVLLTVISGSLHLILYRW